MTCEVGRFNVHQKINFRAKAEGRCLFGNGECERPNTGRVNHITGAFEGMLKGMNPQDIGNIEMNATLECSLHEKMHDIQEQREILIYERPRFRQISRRRNRRTQLFNQPRRSQRRRR